MSANNLRSYFPVIDPVTEEMIEAYVDIHRDGETVTVGDWGAFYDREVRMVENTPIYSGGRRVQPAWLLPHCEAQRQTVIFGNDN